MYSVRGSGPSLVRIKMKIVAPTNEMKIESSLLAKNFTIDDYFPCSRVGGRFALFYITDASDVNSDEWRSVGPSRMWDIDIGVVGMSKGRGVCPSPPDFNSN